MWSSFFFLSLSRCIAASKVKSTILGGDYYGAPVAVITPRSLTRHNLRRATRNEKKITHGGAAAAGRRNVANETPFSFFPLERRGGRRRGSKARFLSRADTVRTSGVCDTFPIFHRLVCVIPLDNSSMRDRRDSAADSAPLAARSPFSTYISPSIVCTLLFVFARVSDSVSGMSGASEAPLYSDDKTTCICISPVTLAPFAPSMTDCCYRYSVTIIVQMVIGITVTSSIIVRPPV